MAFNNLTKKQHRVVTWLAEHLRSERYESQFWWISSDAGSQESPYIRIRELNEGEYKKIQADDTDLQALHDERYITLIQQGSNLKGALNKQAYDEYDRYVEEELAAVTTFEHLRTALDSDQVTLLTEIWNHYLETREWVPVPVFRGRFGRSRVLAALKPLLARRILTETHSGSKSVYQLNLIGSLFTEHGKEYESLLVRYFEYLKQEFIDNPEVEKISSADIDADLELKEDESYLLYRLVFLGNFNSGGGYGGKGNEWHILVPHNIDEYTEIDDFQKFIRDQAMEEYYRSEKRDRKGVDKLSFVLPSNSHAAYVDLDRIRELHDVESPDFDLTKLIRLCEELNICFDNGCYFAIAVLTRSILDHVPPIFNQTNFLQVANNYKGPQSFKKSMQHLENSLRNIADSHLHVQIRRSESLPNSTQVDFSSDLDVLLAEITRILKT